MVKLRDDHSYQVLRNGSGENGGIQVFAQADAGSGITAVADRQIVWEYSAAVVLADDDQFFPAQVL